MNNQSQWQHRLNYAIALAELYPDEPIIHGVLCRAYIDLKIFDKAEYLLRKLVDHSCEYDVLQAELSFSKGDYKAAAEAFDKYQLHDYYHFWRPQFDYKKALAFYYSGQTEKWQKQALKIRRRAKWDRFYGIDDIEDEGIKREPEIDTIINSDERDKCFIDTERITHYLKALCYITKAYFIRHRLAIFLAIVLIYCVVALKNRLG